MMAQRKLWFTEIVVNLVNMEISVVVATMNRGDEIGDLLNSLEKQTFPLNSFEIIIVNDGSTDGTAAILETFGQRTALNFRLISQENRGVSAARNAGIAASQGKFIVFTDDDCIVPAQWLEKLFHALDQQDLTVAGVGGPLDTVVKIPSSLAGRFVKNCDDFNHIPVFGPLVILHRHISSIDEYVNVPYLRTSNSIFRKDALLDVTGFDEAFRQPGGEDPDLCYRLYSNGWSLKINKDILVAHKSRDSFASYFRSLRNYLRGEFRKSSKRHLYSEPVINRTYALLLLRKIAVAGVFTLYFPMLTVSSVRQFGWIDGFVFAGITLLSKFFAIGVTARCQLDALYQRFYV